MNITIPQLDSGKKPHEAMHVDLLLPYPSGTPFGNLGLAEMELLCRADYVNVSLEWLYRTWQTVAHIAGSLPPEVNWIRFRTEDIVYSLRKIFDTLISISFILGECKASGANANKIDIDCIGALLKALDSKGQHPQPWVACYIAHRPFLELLNKVSNAYKHSLANHETLLVHPRQEPAAYYISNPQNKATPNLQLDGVALSHLIDLANSAFKSIRQDHRRLLEH
ncbi:MAG: hypothetical protein NT031_08180 [Planctomycetota bacterium]|nr:hypothetical protein [Planctomycetota bacterium]